MAEHGQVYGFDNSFCKVEVPTKQEHIESQNELNTYFSDEVTLMFNSANQLSAVVSAEKNIKACIVTPKVVAGSAFQQASRYAYETPVDGDKTKVRIIAEGNFVSGHVIRVGFLLKLEESE